MTYNPELRAPENAGITLRGVPVDIQNEDRFSPVNSFAFNPLAQELFSVDNAVLAVVLVTIAKQKPEALVKLMEKYIDSTTDILTSIVNSGKSHPLTALNASTAFAVVAHRFGIITDAGYLKMADQTRSIIDKLIQLNFAEMSFEGLTSLVEGTKYTETASVSEKGAATDTITKAGLAAMLKG